MINYHHTVYCQQVLLTSNSYILINMRNMYYIFSKNDKNLNINDRKSYLTGKKSNVVNVNN